MRDAEPIFMFHSPLLYLGSLFWILFLAIMVWLLIRGIVASQKGTHLPFTYNPGVPPFQQPQHPQQPLQQPSAMEILRQRYARGEVDTDTFEQMRERLEASDRPKD